MSRQADVIEALRDIPLSLCAPLLACARGETPPNMALMQLCLAASDEEAIDDALHHAACARVPCAAIDALCALWRATPGAFSTVKRVAGAVDHRARDVSPEAQLAVFADAFDRAADVSPEAGAALYSLGSAELLDAATQEVVAYMRGSNLLDADSAVFEIGCGAGRFLAALAPHVRAVTGIDISGAMLDAAARRCAAFPNLRLYRSNGRDLAMCGASCIDLVLAIDSFPYIVQCGPELARRHFEEAARF